MMLRLAVLAIGWLACLMAASVWDGVYSSVQASRGEKAYRENCASCHGVLLEGSGQMPPLSGSDFMSNWSGRTLGELFDKIQESMPADRPGKLSRAMNADMLAYILEINKFPAGAKELPPGTPALKTIQIEGERKRK
jgi:S-disulfanyl-L-cysteine oxidoreductase SoxD